MSFSPIRVLIVDNHPMMRQVVVFALADSAVIEVVGEAGSGPEAVDKAAELRPDVVVLDLGLPGIDGFQVLRRLKEVSPESRVVVLTAHDDPDILFRSMRLEIAAYLHKGVDPDEIQLVVERVGRGERAITAEQERSFMHRLSRVLSGSRDDQVRLSERELDVLNLLVAGRSNRQIGEDLHLSTKTVETHISRIYKRLEVRGRLDAVGRARELGLAGSFDDLIEA